MKEYIIPILMLVITFGALSYHYGFFENESRQETSLKTEINIDANKNNELDLFGKKSNTHTAAISGEEQLVYIKFVKGQYVFEPSEVEAGRPVIIKNDGSLVGCGLFIKQPQLGLDMNFAQEDQYKFTPEEKGTFKFSCDMAMFHGELIIK